MDGRCSCAPDSARWLDHGEALERIRSSALNELAQALGMLGPSSTQVVPNLPFSHRFYWYPQALRGKRIVEASVTATGMLQAGVRYSAESHYWRKAFVDAFSTHCEKRFESESVQAVP
ncbi:hypothetical protein CERZMDRAFT_92810 [Cercospora zeae-maydis SCOH1-5]|uniref:Uncharacterized protein n=1 Tax=Cercospora zeae-maydis SCOH1-5 TaxID=717836 RepID=A0A6A6FU53_9PEZI|nr:hypothetical protein CERZMDRAFT_92810 [Cercospora zeae-maydis SCOH1-5]